jgi:hypothetical protein
MDMGRVCRVALPNRHGPLRAGRPARAGGRSAGQAGRAERGHAGAAPAIVQLSRDDVGGTVEPDQAAALEADAVLTPLEATTRAADQVEIFDHLRDRTISAIALTYA